jgi:hypothetical protein
MSGVKHDQEKPDFSLLSPFALEEVAKVMTYGAKKYSANNWRGGFKYTRILAAVMRHLNAYQKGELKDPETGLSHLAHASCGLMMLLEFEKTGIGENDVYWAAKDRNTNDKPERKFEPGQLVKHRYMNKTAILVSPGIFKTATEELKVWTVKLHNSQDTWIEEDFELA